MKAIYFCDPSDDKKKELKTIKLELENEGIPRFPITITTKPPWNEQYDLLFFDWGGMSIGNSMLEHFCEYFIEQAREKPGRAYVMTSMFTGNAMKDALETFSREREGQPDNIFLDVESAANWIRALLKA